MWKIGNISFLRFDNPILRFGNGLVVDLPRPKNISYWWGFGSLLGVFLGVQLIRGLFLAMNYSADDLLSFIRVDTIMRDVRGGWLLRMLHMKGASFFFLLLYLHMGRGLYYHSYTFIELWFRGVFILVVSMAIGFFGYVLPWGKMSYWGAAVITKLFSVIPYIGDNFVNWLWGGFRVGGPTLVRFYAFHFVAPFLLLGLVIVHVVLLHETGSNNPLGLGGDRDKIYFFPFFTSKDLFGFGLVLLVFIFISLGYPYRLVSEANFLEAKCLSTPVHIAPDWFFLPPYAVLRSIPSKLGGVIALLFFILVFGLLPFINTEVIRGYQYLISGQVLFWFWASSIIMLTVIGEMPVKEPYITLGQIGGFFYFRYFFIVGGVCVYFQNVKIKNII